MAFAKPKLKSPGRKRNTGLTLMELLLATALLSAIFLAATSIYVSSVGFFKQIGQNQWKQNGFVAAAHMRRHLQNANRVVLTTSAPNKMRLRSDISATEFKPLGTPGNTADDAWIKYAIINNTLRWRAETVEAGDVTAADPELVPGAYFASGSFSEVSSLIQISFTLSAPTGEIGSVEIRENVAPGLSESIQHEA